MKYRDIATLVGAILATLGPIFQQHLPYTVIYFIGQCFSAVGTLLLGWRAFNSDSAPPTTPFAPTHPQSKIETKKLAP